MLHNLAESMHKPSARAERLGKCGVAAYQAAGLLLAAMIILGCLVGIPVLGTVGTREALVSAPLPPPPSACRNSPPPPTLH